MNRVSTHITQIFGQRRITDSRRDELQTFLDEKCASGLSFSMVDHMRWDLKQIFEMAVAEDLIGKNPARLLFTPGEAKRGERLVMTLEEVKRCFLILDLRERLIVGLAIVAGMRPGEILGLTWQHIGPDYADIKQRVYKGQIDRPKTEDRPVHPARRAFPGLIAALEQWKTASLIANPEACVPFRTGHSPIARQRPQAQHNSAAEGCWVGLGQLPGDASNALHADEEQYGRRRKADSGATGAFPRCEAKRLREVAGRA